MADFEIYESAVRSREDLGAVFEHDGDTGYFYLVEDPHSESQNEDETNIVAYIWILNGKPDFGQDDVAVEWDRAERRVGLFIKGRLWAVFDQFGARYGGRYRPEEEPTIPDDIVEEFKPPTN